MAAVDASWLRGKPPPEMTTSSPPLVLRRFRPRYAAALAGAVNASLEHLRPWMAWVGEPVSESDEAALLREGEARFDAGTDFVFLIFSPAEDVVGGCGLHARRGPGVMEIGYWLHVDHTGKGYATAAIGRLVEEAFSFPEVQRVEIRCDETNRPSAAVARRLGFALARLEERVPRTPAETPREMLWVLTRTAYS